MNDVNWSTLSQFGESVIPEKLQFINDLNAQMGQQVANPTNPYLTALQSLGSDAGQLYGKGIDAFNPQRAFTSYDGQRRGPDLGYEGFNPEEAYMRQIGKYNTVANYGRIPNG